MWKIIARIILRNRLSFLIGIFLFTLFMGYEALHVNMSYTYASMLPESDSTNVEYLKFKEKFGEEANIFVVGFKDSTFFTPDKFNEWKAVNKRVNSLYGVGNVLSVSEIKNLVKDKKHKNFKAEEVFSKDKYNQQELDSLKKVVYNLPFYKNLLFNDTANVFLAAIRITDDVLNDEKRIATVDSIKTEYDKFSKDFNLKLHFSGLPYIRTAVSIKIKKELNMFIIFALFVCIVILYVFFRSFKVVFFSILVVLISVVWVMGTIQLFGYKITIFV